MNEQIIAVDFDGTLCENKWPDGFGDEKNVRTLFENLQNCGHFYF